MAPPPDLSQEVKQRLVEAATLLFAEKSFDGVGIREIAAKAQANSAMVAYHFGGKEGLYLQVLRAGFLRCPSQVAELDPIPEPGHPQARELALAGLQAHIRVFVSELLLPQCDPLRHASSVLLMRELAVGGPLLEELNREFMHPYFTHLRDCVRILRPDWLESQTLFAMAAIHGSAMIYKFIPAAIKLNSDAVFPPDPVELADFLTDYTLRALGVAPQGA